VPQEWTEDGREYSDEERLVEPSRSRRVGESDEVDWKVAAGLEPDGSAQAPAARIKTEES
jgi:hypothetical protein